MSSMAEPWPASRVTEPPSDFAGQVVLVTGGTRGIGRAIATAFLERGATVVICGRGPPAEPVEAAGAEAEFLAADIRDATQVDALIDAIEACHGRLDVLINNAGGSPAADPATASPRFSEAIVRLNLLAPLFAAQAAYRLMHHQKTGGVIINIASIAATRPSPTVAAYGAAKAGLLNLTNSLAVAWAPRIRVNAIIAGTVRTEQMRLHYNAEGERRMNAIIPAGRAGEPSEIANACLFLASAQAAYITGAHLAVHGGGERPAFLDAAELT
jgi:NAD(P)-dependent dehydrogenase (short-subunit alcohol dehydrogenase family)